MKFSTILSSLVSISLGRVNANNSAATLRGSIDQNRRGLRVQQPCTLVRVEGQYEAQLEEYSGSKGSKERLNNGNARERGPRQLHEAEQRMKCELQADDRAAVGKYFVTINGIETSQLDNVVSGDTTLMAEGAMIMDGEMWIPADAAIEFGSNGQNTRRLNYQRNHGIKKVIVIRADGQGAVTTTNSEELADKVFGTYGDSVTLKSQYLACSHGKLEMQPYVGMTEGGTYIDNGVLDVTIDTYVPGTNRHIVEDALEAAADELIGNLADQFDHVMLCLPPGSTSMGTNDRWVAYGYVNSWLSVYNDDFCESMSTQVHEIGHNLGLAHSGKDGVSYGDKSGMMGFSYKSDNGPLQCFNPAKTYQLGWFSDKTVEVDPSNGGWVGTVIGATDYTNTIVNQNAHVIVKIITGESNDLFIGFNRKKGANAGVPLAGDRLTIIEQGYGYSQSDFVASLSLTSNTHTFSNFGGTNKDLVVEFERGRSFDEAIVSIYYQGEKPDSNGSNSNVSLTSPTPPPTIRVTPSPTELETEPPTWVPTLNPTVIATTPPTLQATPPPTLQATPPPTLQATPPPTDPEIVFDIEYNTGNNQNVNDQNIEPQPLTPLRLVSETFRNGLGAFRRKGDTVSPTTFEYILSAKFELNDASNPASVETVLDLQGRSTIEISFWYYGKKMQSDEGFRIQYSTARNVWTTVKTFSFFDGDLDKTGYWNSAKKETFTVSPWIDKVMVRIIGDTPRTGGDSTFYVASVNIDAT